MDYKSRNKNFDYYEKNPEAFEERKRAKRFEKIIELVKQAKEVKVIKNDGQIELWFFTKDRTKSTYFITKEELLMIENHLRDLKGANT